MALGMTFQSIAPPFLIEMVRKSLEIAQHFSAEPDAKE